MKDRLITHLDDQTLPLNLELEPKPKQLQKKRRGAMRVIILTEYGNARNNSNSKYGDDTNEAMLVDISYPRQ